MTETPRRRAKITRTWVFFESRDPKLASVRWHPRFKQHYRTKAQAQEAKRLWEEEARILRVGELVSMQKPKTAARDPKEMPVQQGMSL